MISRRMMIAGAATAALFPSLAMPGTAGAGMPPVPAFHPLPDNLTPAFLREMAASSRASSIGYPADTPLRRFFKDRLMVDAEIWERMALQQEPYEVLESEQFRRERALMAHYGVKP
jgi:hypothetical protein